MGRYRKKPIEIDAVQWKGEVPLTGEQVQLMADNTYNTGEIGSDRFLSVWNTEENQFIDVPVGHWLIRGIKGEVYPCSPEVFNESYEEV